MKVKWYGHASFLIVSDKGTKIITDPYEPGGYGGAIGYGKIPDEADIVLVSHDHADHNFVKGLPGKPKVIQGVGSHRSHDIEFRGIAAFHDGKKGAERGQNTIFCFLLDGIRVCHLGDLGHIPSAQEAKAIGPIDLLMMPVGGVYTIDAAEATKTLEILNPRVAIPMHFKTPKCGFPLAQVDEFTKGKAGLKSLPGSDWEVKKETLPQKSEIIVLQPAL